jgi:ABC-type multidrug transport system ATPase subunit
VLLDGQPLGRVPRQAIGLVPQEPCLIPTLTVRETLTVAARLMVPAGLSGG